MHGTGAGSTGSGPCRSGARSGCERLAGPDSSLVNRLPWSRGRRTRSARSGGQRLAWSDLWLCLSETCEDVRPWRHNWPSGWLANQGSRAGSSRGLWGLRRRRGRLWGQFGRLRRWRRRTRHTRNRNRSRGNADGRSRGSDKTGKRLARSTEDLSRTGRRNGLGGYGGGPGGSRRRRGRLGLPGNSQRRAQRVRHPGRSYRGTRLRLMCFRSPCSGGFRQSGQRLNRSRRLDLGDRLRLHCGRRARFLRWRLSAHRFGHGRTEISAHKVGGIVVNRTGMGLLLSHTELGQEIDDPARLHFELACQLVDTNLTHREYCKTSLNARSRIRHLLRVKRAMRRRKTPLLQMVTDPVQPPCESIRPVAIPPPFVFRRLPARAANPNPGPARWTLPSPLPGRDFPEAQRSRSPSPALIGPRRLPPAQVPPA